MTRKKEKAFGLSKRKCYRQLSLADIRELDAKYTHESELIMEAEQNEETMIRMKHEKVQTLSKILCKWKQDSVIS